MLSRYGSSRADLPCALVVVVAIQNPVELHSKIIFECYVDELIK